MTDQSQQTPAPPVTNPPVTTPNSTDQTTTPPPESKPIAAEGSLVTEGTKDAIVAKPEGAPEKYEAFTLPEGYEANEPVLTEATGLFKEIGLSQAQAQKLVDFYSKVSADAADAGVKLWQDTQTAWREEVKADPVIGGQKLGPVMATIKKAINTIGDAKLISEFHEAMNITGAGNNPAFIRAFHSLAQKLVEGGPVSGKPESSQKPPATAGAALYPNLKSSG